MHRRTLIQAAAIAAPYTAMLAMGVLPRRSVASWPADAFRAEDTLPTPSACFSAHGRSRKVIKS